MKYTFVQGDTLPILTETIKGPNGVAVDLTGATVKFHLWRPGEAAKVNAAGSVYDASGGIVKYSWGTTDLNTPGLYNAEWEITFIGGGIQTTHLFQIQVRESI
jgi:hypothetical protein